MFSCKYFQVSKERYVFKEHSRIRLTTIYIHHTHAHLDLIVWLNSLWIRCLTLQYMYCKYALSCYHHSYELHISPSCRKKGITLFLPWWGSTNTTYFERLESIIQWNLWVLFWKLIKTPEQWWNKETWDIELDLIILSLNCWRPKWRLQAPWLKVIWVILKVISVYSNPEENF